MPLSMLSWRQCTWIISIPMAAIQSSKRDEIENTGIVQNAQSNYTTARVHTYMTSISVFVVVGICYTNRWKMGRDGGKQRVILYKLILSLRLWVMCTVANTSNLAPNSRECDNSNAKMNIVWGEIMWYKTAEQSQKINRKSPKWWKTEKTEMEKNGKNQNGEKRKTLK